MIPDSREDSALVESCRGGDTAAFDRLVLKYEDRVYSLAYRLTGNPDDALDVAQEAFMKAFQSIGRFQGCSSFYTWIYRITANTAVSRRRYRTARPKTVSLGGIVEGERGALPSDPNQADPAEDASQADLVRLVEEAIKRLDDEHRVVIVLRDIEGRNYEEIGEIIDCPQGTVKSRLHRARRMLRDILSAVLPAE